MAGKMNVNIIITCKYILWLVIWHDGWCTDHTDDSKAYQTQNKT